MNGTKMYSKIINICELVYYYFFHHYRLLNKAFEELPTFHRALKEFVGTVDVNFAKSKEELFVGFEGSFGSKHVSPRTLTSRNLGNLVCVEGIVTKCKCYFLPLFMV